MAIPNPLAPLRGQLQVTALMLAGGGALALIASVVRNLADPNPLGALVAGGVAIFLWSVAGHHAWLSMRARREVPLPSRAPTDFEDPHAPIAALKAKELYAHRRMEPGLVRWVSRRLGIQRPHGTDRTLWLANHCWKAAQTGYLWGTFSILVGAAAIASSTAFGVGAVLAGIVAVAGGSAYIVASVWRTRALVVLFDEEEPALDPLEELVTVRGGGDPRVLAADIERALAAVKHPAHQNRVTKAGWTSEAHSINDVGSFSGWLFLETHPTPEPPEPPVSLRMLAKGDATLLVGIVLTIIGLFLGPAAAVFATFTTVPIIMAGNGWIRDGVIWHSRFRWTSQAVLVEAEGSSGRTETRVGNAYDDTFTSTNVTIRSDGQFRVYTGTFETESSAVDGGRSVVGVRSTDVAREASQLVLRVLREFEHVGVRLRNVDVEHGAMTFVQANVAATKAKAPAPRPQALPGVSAPSQVPGAIESFTERKPSFCTGCGAGLGADARFCGHCGTAAVAPAPPQDR